MTARTVWKITPLQGDGLVRLGCYSLLISIASLLSCKTDPSDSRYGYQKNSTIFIQFNPIVGYDREFDIFANTFLMRLKIFSDDKRNFQIPQISWKDSLSAYDYRLSIAIDSLSLVDYEKYSQTFAKKDRKVDTMGMRNQDIITGSVVLPVPLSIALNIAVQTGYKKTLYQIAMKPSMIAVITLVSARTGRPEWVLRQRVESLSYVPIREHEQIGQLFSILQNKIEESLGFYYVRSRR
jgi:hypothetical protein